MKENGDIKSWNDLKNEFELEQRLYFKWLQLVNAIPSNGKTILKTFRYLLTEPYFLHLVKSNLLFQYRKARVKRTLPHYKFLTQTTYF